MLNTPLPERWVCAYRDSGSPFPPPRQIGATTEQALANAQVWLSRRKFDVKRRKDHLEILGSYTGVKLLADIGNGSLSLRFDRLGKKPWVFLHLGLFNGLVDFFNARHLRRTIHQSLSGYEPDGRVVVKAMPAKARP